MRSWYSNQIFGLTLSMGPDSRNLAYGKKGNEICLLDAIHTIR